jgi:hypothetical protein
VDQTRHRRQQRQLPHPAVVPRFHGRPQQNKEIREIILSIKSNS